MVPTLNNLLFKFHNLIGETFFPFIHRPTKIHAVIYNVDLGYHVQAAFFDKIRAEQERDRLISERYEYHTQQVILCARAYQNETITYEEAKKRAEFCYQNNEFEVIEIEVV
jgi:hypothetical protein